MYGSCLSPPVFSRDKGVLGPLPAKAQALGTSVHGGSEHRVRSHKFNQLVLHSSQGDLAWFVSVNLFIVVCLFACLRPPE